MQHTAYAYLTGNTDGIPPCVVFAHRRPGNRSHGVSHRVTRDLSDLSAADEVLTETGWARDGDEWHEAASGVAFARIGVL